MLQDMSLTPYECSLQSEDEADELLDETIGDRSARGAAAKFKLHLTHLGRGPGDIWIREKGGRLTVFSWDLQEKKGD
jgi:hypothetical protein